MANIRKRISNNGTVRWQASVRKGGRTLYKTFQRKTDALAYAREVETKIDRGELQSLNEARNHTLSEAIDRYLFAVLPGKKASTQAVDKQRLSWWACEIGDLTLDKITSALVLEKREQMTSGPTTRNHYVIVLRHLLKSCVSWHWIPSNLLEKIEKLKIPRGRVRYLSRDEKNRLLAACRESQQPLLYPIVVFALETGARRGEILGLRRSDVDLRRKLVVFHETKNDDRRVLPLEGEAYQLIRDLLAVPRIDSDLVFPGKIGTVIDIKKSWNNAMEKAGIEDFRFHDLRHTFASYLAMSGATLAEIAEALGHRTLDMVRRYAHLSEAHTASVVRRMREKFLA